jgi:DNA repair protein RadC
MATTIDLFNADVLTTVAEVQLVYKTKVKPIDRIKVLESKDAENIFRKLWDTDQMELREEFKILLLNRANTVLGVFNVSQGGVAGTVVDPKLVFQAALKANASAIILCHNHPSGNLQPSQADIKLTKQLQACGKFLELEVTDHIIITATEYYSMTDKGDI